MTDHYTITFEYEQSFTRDELWPDGDAPDIITADTVRELIEQEGGPRRVVRDWFFHEPDVHVTVPHD